MIILRDFFEKLQLIENLQDRMMQETCFIINHILRLFYLNFLF